MTLEELTRQILEAEKLSNTDPDEYPPYVRPAWSTKIAEAKAQLGNLKASYGETLLKNGVAIFLEGDSTKAREFADLVLAEGEGLAVDAMALYRRLAEAVEQTFSPSNRQWGVAQTHKLHLTLQEVMAELKLDQIDMPARGEPVLPKFDDVVNYIRKSIRQIGGDELNRLYVEAQAAKNGLTIRYMGSLAPTVILNARDDEKNSLAHRFAKGTATLTVTKEDTVDKDFLVKSFKHVNKVIRKK